MNRLTPKTDPPKRGILIEETTSGQLRAGDLFVHASNDEGFGMAMSSMLEGWSLCEGMPVLVATGVPTGKPDRKVLRIQIGQAP